MLEFGWTRHMIRTILVLSFDLCVHFFMVFLCLSHKQKLQEHFPLFIGLLILFEMTYKLTIYEYIPLKEDRQKRWGSSLDWDEQSERGKNKAGYTAQDAPSMRTFHLRK